MRLILIALLFLSFNTYSKDKVFCCTVEGAAIPKDIISVFYVFQQNKVDCDTVEGIQVETRGKCSKDWIDHYRHLVRIK